MTQSKHARSQILENLRAVKQGDKVPYETVVTNEDYFTQANSNLAESFKKTLIAIAGNCELCESEENALMQIQKLLGTDSAYVSNQDLFQKLQQASISVNSDDSGTNCKYAITTCEALSARTASILVTSETMQGRRAIAAPETHIVLAYENQLVPDLPDALKEVSVENPPSQITIITGPSRTADIEKTLVLGAHGPKNLFVFLVK